MKQKKITRFLSVGAALGILSFGGGALAQQIQVVVNGNPVVFGGQGPTMVGDRVLVPLRGVLEQMGARVDWDPSSQTVSARRDRSTVKLAIGQNTAAVNGQPVNLDVPAQIMNGSTMVPLRFVGEALGENVHWDASSSTVTISGGDYEIPPARDRDHDRDRRRPQAPPPPPPPPMGPPIYEAGTVIPVSFDISLGSGESRPGQRFSTVISDYPGIPNGSRVEGVVRDSAPAGGRQSGALELAFDTIVTPTGHRYHIDGQAVPMNDPNISRGSNGRLVASKGVASKRYLFANAGGSAKLVNVNSRAAISDPRTQKEIGQRAPAGGPARNVQLSPGMKFGIRLNAAVKLK